MILLEGNRAILLVNVSSILASSATFFCFPLRLHDEHYEGTLNEWKSYDKSLTMKLYTKVEHDGDDEQLRANIDMSTTASGCVKQF